MTLKSDAKFEEKLKHSKVSTICTMIGSYCAKYLIFDVKKCRGVVFHDTEE